MTTIGFIGMQIEIFDDISFTFSVICNFFMWQSYDSAQNLGKFYKITVKEFLLDKFSGAQPANSLKVGSFTSVLNDID